MNYAEPYCKPTECQHNPNETDCWLCCPCDSCGQRRFDNEAYERIARRRMEHDRVALGED